MEMKWLQSKEGIAEVWRRCDGGVAEVWRRCGVGWGVNGGRSPL
jgi:hypothetical protein